MKKEMFKRLATVAICLSLVCSSLAASAKGFGKAYDQKGSRYYDAATDKCYDDYVVTTYFFWIPVGRSRISIEASCNMPIDPGSIVD